MGFDSGRADMGAQITLARALQDPEELVRGYAAWAVGKIGGAQGRKILESGLARETAESVKKEIQDALQST